MRSWSLHTALVISILLSACVAPGGLPTGSHFLRPGQSVSSSDGSIVVTVVEVLEDSRCPADAMCIWQGNVKVLIEVTQRTETQRHTLTLGELLEGDMSSIIVGDSTLTLIQVDPYPLASQPTNPEQHLITISIQ